MVLIYVDYSKHSPKLKVETVNKDTALITEYAHTVNTDTALIPFAAASSLSCLFCIPPHCSVGHHHTSPRPETVGLRNIARFLHFNHPQDLDFEIASSRMRLSKDGKYLAATGVYPPQVVVTLATHHGDARNRNTPLWGASSHICARRRRISASCSAGQGL